MDLDALMKLQASALDQALSGHDELMEKMHEAGMLKKEEIIEFRQDLNKLIELRLDPKRHNEASSFHAKIIEKFKKLEEREREKL